MSEYTYMSDRMDPVGLVHVCEEAAGGGLWITKVFHLKSNDGFPYVYSLTFLEVYWLPWKIELRNNGLRLTDTQCRKVYLHGKDR